MCTKCKLDVPLTQFAKCARAKDGLQWECKSCWLERSREYYKGPGGDKKRASHRRWVERHKEHVKEYSKLYNKGKKGSSRGSYERIYQAGIVREQFSSDAEFAQALNRFQNASLAARNRVYVNALKQAPCTDCGKTFDPICMDYDHVSGDKETEIGKMIYKNRSIESIQAEIDKCELVCACCHRLRTKNRYVERRMTP